MKKTIKAIFKPGITFLVSTDFIWNIITHFLRFGKWLSFERSNYDHVKATEQLKIYFNDRTVRSGFFRGLKYPDFSSFGSSIFPKLLGSYEVELLHVFNSFSKNNYQQIVDIGCAEGYYAVGLALQFPKAVVHGFDIDPTALQLCKELAAFNGVTNQIVLNDACTAVTINNLELIGRSFFICDCEGFERELFNASNCSNLQHADLIIELHPFAAKGVKEYLVDLFSATHQLNIISSQDNNRKIFDFVSSLPGMNDLEKLIAVEEGRTFTMDWLIAESKLVKK